MKKIIIAASIAFATLMAVDASAQNARETQVSYMKNNVTAFSADYNVPKKVLQEVAENYFKDNIKGKQLKSKDFRLFKGVNWETVLGQDKGDVYYKVEGKKNKSTLTLMVSKGYDNFVSGSSDAQVANNAKNFLNGFGDALLKYNKSQAIEDQKKLIEKTEKEHKGMESDQKKLEKKIADMQKELESMKKKVADKETEVKKEKSKLVEISK